MMDPTNQQVQPAEGAAQGVYVGGTYPATLTRAAQRINLKITRPGTTIKNYCKEKKLWQV